MKLAIMQPYFFPYIGYFQLIHSVDKFVFLDDVNYIKQGWIHRNRIQAGNQIIYFGVQTSKASQNQKINEVSLNSDSKWRDKLLKRLHHSYSKAPNFTEIQPIVESVITLKTDKISDMCKDSVKKACGYLNINTEIIDSSSEFDVGLCTGPDRILKVCKDTNADHYTNAIGGKALYDVEAFSKEGVKLNFIEMGSIDYKNSSLSIIDLLMHCSKDDIKQYLCSYSLS